ncbi:hypothetical protein ACWF99_23825 [Nocardia sp. NPDC055002]
MTLNELDPLMADIKKAGRFISYQWPGVMEADDAQQAISLHLLERPGSIAKIKEMDARAQYRAIVGIGNQLAAAERADYDYYKGSYRYDVAEVKSVLELGVLTENVDGWDEAVHDLMEALEVLTVKTPQYANAILSRYADWIVPESGSDKVQLSRALNSLADAMNKSNRRRFVTRDSGPGSRPVSRMTVDHQTTALDYDGDENADDWD